MPTELFTFPSEGALADSVAALWLDQLDRRTPGRNYCVALSGGRIARTFFAKVAELAESRAVSLDAVHFFWADERCVPPDDPECNYRIASELLFEPLGVPAGQIHRVRGEADEALALREAGSEITTATAGGLGQRGGQPVLDLVFLGMGEDGHVASLFPGEGPDVTSSAAVYRAVTAVKPPPRRITVGYGVLAVAQEVWVLASGKGKEQALRESLSPGGGTPLARVLRSRKTAKVFSDIAGAR